MNGRNAGRQSVSIHAPLARSNRRAPAGRAALRCFNTCSSCEEQLRTDARLSFCLGFQYMLLLRGATSPISGLFKSGSVSIHAPLARSNLIADLVLARFDVSIHAPLARSNVNSISSSGRHSSFNTCSSCEEQLDPLTGSNPFAVSIHAPLARSNKRRTSENSGSRVSIHAPLARSNIIDILEIVRVNVSIHAPLARSNG